LQRPSLNQVINGGSIYRYCECLLMAEGENSANACVAIDGSKFKAANSRDRNLTRAKMKRRLD